VVDAADERAAAGHDEAAVHEVGGKFGRAALEGAAHSVHDGGDGVVERLANFLRGDVDGLGQAGHGIAAFDLHREFLVERVGGTDAHLDFLGRALADEEIVGALHVTDDGVVELIAGHADGF